MKRIFVPTVSDFEREFSRSRAKGYKNLVIDDDVISMGGFDFQTDGTTLRMVADNTEVDAEDEIYTILTKEFGLVGGATHFKNDLSVIFLDNGWMLVTIRKGSIVVRIDGDMFLPSIGVTETPTVISDDIAWVNADYLLSYSNTINEPSKSLFMYDYEIFLSLGGHRVGGMWNSELKFYLDQFIDLSLGYIAQYEHRVKTREEAKAAKSLFDSMMSGRSDEEVNFDDEYLFGEDEEDDEYADYESDEDDDDDYN